MLVQECGSRASKRCGGAAFGARGCLQALCIDFGGLLEKHLFLGRTLLLRLWACQATVVRLAGWLVGWLDGWLVGWLVGWMVGWMDGCLVSW